MEEQTKDQQEEKKEQPLSSLPICPRALYQTFILTDAIFEVEKRYSVDEIVGSGAYGVVCSAHDHKYDIPCAIKKIDGITEHTSLAKRTLRELKLLRMFQHENILSINRVMWPKSAQFESIQLVMDLMETDLAMVIRSPQILTDEHNQFFIYQLLRGLKYMHSANVMHRDLKPRNLLVNSNCDLKICDFGLARVSDPERNGRTQMSSYIATRWYRAPEVIVGCKPYTKAVDMWSVGCVLAELLGRQPIFPGRDSFHQVTLITKVLGTPPDSKNLPDLVRKLPARQKIEWGELFPDATPEACDLLDKLLCFDPKDRITVQEALEHPYMRDLHCPEDEPECDTLDLDDFLFEYEELDKEDLRELIHLEIVRHYPKDAYSAAIAARIAEERKRKEEEKEQGSDDSGRAPASMIRSLPLPRLPSSRHIRRRSF